MIRPWQYIQCWHRTSDGLRMIQLMMDHRLGIDDFVHTIYVEYRHLFEERDNTLSFTYRDRFICMTPRNYSILINRNRPQDEN